MFTRTTLQRTAEEQMPPSSCSVGIQWLCPARSGRSYIFYVARNGDLNGVMSSMKQLEDRFNKKFNYPYVFLNEEPFSEDFIACALFIYTVQLSTHDIPLQPYIRGHRF